MSIPKKQPLQAGRRTSHYFDPTPAAASKPRSVFLHLPGLDLELQADRGVFGSRGIDLGTLSRFRDAPTPPAAGHRPALVPAAAGSAPLYSTLQVRLAKAPLHELLLRWLPQLEPGASAYLDVQRNLGSDSLAAWLATQGYEVTRIKSKKGYRILGVRARDS